MSRGSRNLLTNGKVSRKWVEKFLSYLKIFSSFVSKIELKVSRKWVEWVESESKVSRKWVEWVESESKVSRVSRKWVEWVKIESKVSRKWVIIESSELKLSWNWVESELSESKFRLSELTVSRKWAVRYFMENFMKVQYDVSWRHSKKVLNFETGLNCFQSSTNCIDL